MNTIGERIKFLRKKFGITQKQLSAGTNIPYGNISHYEKGDFKPSSESSLSISKFFNIPVEWLINGNGDPFNITELEKAKDLINEIYLDGTKMSSKDKNKLAKVIEGALGDVMLSTNNPNGNLSDEDLAIVTNAIKYAFVMMKKDQQELKKKREKDEKSEK